MAPPTQEQFDALKKQVESLKGQLKKQADKIKSGFEKVSSTRDSTADFDFAGGAFNIFDEGSKIFKSYGEQIKNTGKLAELLSGPEGFVSKFARMAESGTEIFGGIDAMTKSLQDLNENMTTFTMLDEATQTQLGKSAAVFKDLGVNVTDFTGVLDSAMIGFGMTTKEAEGLTNAVANVGTGIKGGMGEAMKNFKMAQSSMAYDTSRLLENFKQLQFTASTTGVEFSKLTSVFGEQFDSFEGASGKAGQLNAILGRSVFNSIDLLGKTEGERVQTIIQGIKESTNVEALQRNKFQLKAIADGLGLTPDETRRLLTGQMSVDQALATKEPKDPREKALKAMAEIVGSNVNPGLETFTALLESSRTELEKLKIAYMSGARGFTQGLAASLGLGTDTTPAQIYNRIEQSVMGLDLGAIKTKNLIDEAKKIFDTGIAAFGEAKDSGMSTTASIKNTIKALKDIDIDIGIGIKPPKRTAATVSTQAKSGERRGADREVQTAILERAEEAKAEALGAAMAKGLKAGGIDTVVVKDKVKGK